MRNCKARYLIFFQYLGTKYCGVMKAPEHQLLQGVQNHLEKAARNLKPVNEVVFSISSRTDTGVHALCNSAHVDIQRRDNKPPFTGRVLTEALNYYLKTEPIRIIHAYRVPSAFHARYRALSRTYVYRLATGCNAYHELPLTENNLCWLLLDTQLNIKAMQEAAACLLGTKDFSSFRALSSETAYKDPVKTLLCAHVGASQGSFSQRYFQRNLQYWELTFKSKSFLYKQVRRMTGALVAVGQGKLTVSQLKALLEVKDSLAYPNNMAAPPQGLFLTGVEYAEADLISELC